MRCARMADFVPVASRRKTAATPTNLVQRYPHIRRKLTKLYKMPRTNGFLIKSLIFARRSSASSKRVISCSASLR